METRSEVSFKFTEKEIVIPKNKMVEVGNLLHHKLLFGWVGYYNPKTKKYCCAFFEQFVDLAEIEYRILQYRFKHISQEANKNDAQWSFKLGPFNYIRNSRNMYACQECIRDGCNVYVVPIILERQIRKAVTETKENEEQNNLSVLSVFISIIKIENK